MRYEPTIAQIREDIGKNCSFGQAQFLHSELKSENFPTGELYSRKIRRAQFELVESNRIRKARKDRHAKKAQKARPQ